jgi:hypothetical protein
MAGRKPGQLQIVEFNHNLKVKAPSGNRVVLFAFILFQPPHSPQNTNFHGPSAPKTQKMLKNFSTLLLISKLFKLILAPLALTRLLF